MAEDHGHLLDELAGGEDDFDVDLMAAGCRLPLPRLTDTVEDAPQQLVSLYEFGTDELVEVFGRLIAEGLVDTKTLFRVAEDVATSRAS
jgi:hypothetical protein